MYKARGAACGQPLSSAYGRADSSKRCALSVLGRSLLSAAGLVGIDHLLDHLSAYGACLAGGKVAVIALLEVHADLVSCLHLESLESLSAFVSGDTFHF